MLRGRLEQSELDEIVQFGKLFHEYRVRAYTWDLWAAAYIISGGCSDDGFMDFRGWLISSTRSDFSAGATRRGGSQVVAGSCPALLPPGKLLVFPATVCELLAEE